MTESGTIPPPAPPRRRTTALAGAAAVALLAFTPFLQKDGAQAQERAPRPNVIVILADDLGYGDTGVYGSKTVRTPYIDALAASGVRFTNGYVSHPVCAPSRAGLLTGRYQERFGYEFNGSDRPNGVSLNEIMIAQVMKQAGYATGMVGKWHQGREGPYYPTSRGFDSFFGMQGGGTDYITDPKPGDAFGSLGSDAEVEDEAGAAASPADTSDLAKLRQKLEAIRTRAPITRNGVLVHETEYLTDALTREALNFIDAHHDKPFFLYVAQHAPHTPLQAPKKYYDRFPNIADKNTRIVAAMISALDDGVGAIESRLKSYGLERNTLVIFLSDNGCPSYVHGACTNTPLVGFKRTHFEGGVRIPYIVSWPGHLPAGRVDDRTVSSLDIFPTAVAVARGKLPDDRPYDGVNLIPFLTAKRTETPNPVLYWRAGPTFAIRDHDWKMIVMNNAPPGAKAGNGMRIKAGDSDPANLPPYPAIYGQHTMLYDLKAGPVETHNIATRQPTVVARLKAELAQWNKILVPPQKRSMVQTYDLYDGVMLHFFD